MTDSFVPGDVVRIKSGGPQMTVESAGISAMTGTPFVFCVWFDKTKKETSSFAPEAT